MKDIPLLLFRALYLPLPSMLSAHFRPARAIQANFIWCNFQMLMKIFLYHSFQGLAQKWEAFSASEQSPRIYSS